MTPEELYIRTCESKAAYPTVQRASKGGRRAYKCPYCGKVHITSQQYVRDTELLWENPLYTEVLARKALYDAYGANTKIIKRHDKYELRVA